MMNWNFQKVRSIVLSNFHFGLPFGRSDQLFDSTSAENMYLLGDISDGTFLNHIAFLETYPRRNPWEFTLQSEDRHSDFLRTR